MSDSFKITGADPDTPSAAKRRASVVELTRCALATPKHGPVVIRATTPKATPGVTLVAVINIKTATLEYLAPPSPSKTQEGAA